VCLRVLRACFVRFARMLCALCAHVKTCF
jgi:hypothetical protein